MSSRQEEKERRRQERLAVEQEAARSAARRKRLGVAAGGVLALAAVAAIVVAITASGGGNRPKLAGGKAAPIPTQRTKDLAAAVAAAGCRMRTFVPGPNDRNHVTGKVRYRQNPPVFGPHAPAPASDGNYVGQGTPATENLVHSLEHGRVELQYKPGLPERRIRQLQALFNEPFNGQPQGYKQLLFENRTGMPFAVGATAWGQQLGCPTFNDKTFDALRAFRATYVDKAPEQIPFPE